MHMHWRPVVVHTVGVAIAVVLAYPRQSSSGGAEADWFGSGQIIVVYGAMATVMNNVPVISRWVYGDLLKQSDPNQSDPESDPPVST